MKIIILRVNYISDRRRVLMAGILIASFLLVAPGEWTYQHQSWSSLWQKVELILITESIKPLLKQMISFWHLFFENIKKLWYSSLLFQRIACMSKYKKNLSPCWILKSSTSMWWQKQTENNKIWYSLSQLLLFLIQYQSIPISSRGTFFKKQ